MAQKMPERAAIGRSRKGFTLPFATNPDEGHRIHFELKGSGPPLIYRHGFTGSHEHRRI